MASDVVESLLGAVQAAVSVLLTVGWGVLAGQWQLLDLHSTRQISRLCVDVFLPALLVTKVGSQLDSSNVARYAAIAVWSLTYTLVSIVLAIGLKRALKLPSWSIVATAFNNTTALPLLLTETLAAAGILQSLLASETDTVEAAVSRAQSYFLVNSLCGNVTTFALGPKLLDGPGDQSGEDDRQEQSGDATSDAGDETTSLLPTRVEAPVSNAKGSMKRRGNKVYRGLPHVLQRTVDFLAALFTPQFVGGLVGIIIGLVPPLHRAFFSSVQDGGFFNAWLTTSVQNIGDLFAALQVVAVGVKLSACLRKMVRGEESGVMPWRSLVSILSIRFIVWPVISIAVIYAISSRTQILADDPILWFVMMMMPCGPSAMNLTSLSDVAGSEDEQFGLAKFLTISYAFSPLLAFAVAGARKASEVVIDQS